MKSVIKNPSGSYFVEGQGFAGTQASASRYDSATATAKQACIASCGLGSTTLESVSEVSYAVVHIRKGDIVTATGISKNQANSTLNQFDPSKRRFATRAEANTHGKRFDTRRANKADAKGSGTAGHVGFYVIETNDPVNAYVNPATGLTNRL